MGMPDTTMATIMVSSTARRPTAPSIAPSSSSSMSSLLRRNSTSATPAHLLPTPLISVSYTAHTPPPKKLSSTSVLVRIWAVAVDGYDALAARDAAPGFIPGRSFVGKVVEWGDACAGMFVKGEFVFGLRDLKRSGALSEFIVIERRYLAKAPQVSSSGLDGDDEGLTLEDIAALPLLGVTAHRAVGGIPRGSRALVLLSAEPPQGSAAAAESAGPSDWAVGVLACQELLARGVIVVLQVTHDQGEVWARQHMPSLREGHVRVGDAVEVVHSEHEGSFDLVLDCVGGRRLYDASRRILSTGGQ
jgi:NADPH:quinone reductase-like Zn-dependent oxidoreductase